MRKLRIGADQQKRRFGLRSHVDVDLTVKALTKRANNGMAIARQIGVSCAHDTDQELVAQIHDEKILSERIGAREGGQRRKADRDPVCYAIDLNGIGAEIAAQDIGEPGKSSV